MCVAADNDCEQPSEEFQTSINDFVKERWQQSKIINSSIQARKAKFNKTDHFKLLQEADLTIKIFTYLSLNEYLKADPRKKHLLRVLIYHRKN